VVVAANPTELKLIEDAGKAPLELFTEPDSDVTPELGVGTVIAIGAGAADAASGIRAEVTVRDSPLPAGAGAAAGAGVGVGVEAACAPAGTGAGVEADLLADSALLTAVSLSLSAAEPAAGPALPIAGLLALRAAVDDNVSAAPPSVR